MPMLRPIKPIIMPMIMPTMIIIMPIMFAHDSADD